MVESNELERRRWNDERWARLWPKREQLTESVTSYLLAAAQLRPGERVLDVGCGGGRLSLAAARLVGHEGAVTGADISEPMLGLARERADEAGSRNVAFVQVDVQVEEVPGGPFAIVLSQFGVMFFDEPVVAFSNIAAQLVPGGRIAFACWQPVELNAWMFSAALAGFAPPPPPPEPGKSPTGPFSLADVAHTTEILELAGFEDVRSAGHELTIDLPRDAIYDPDQLAINGIPVEQRAAAAAAVEAYLARFEIGDGLSRFPLAFQIFTAARP
jgi:SAM-dependent methyltransferase